MNGIERVIFNFKELSGNGTLLAVFFLALLILWLHEEQKEWRIRIVYPSLFLLFFMLNPILMEFVWIPIFYGETELYTVSRMYVFLPVVFVIAYLFTVILLKVKETKKRIGAIVGIGFILILTSETVYTDDGMKLPENLYGVPQSVVEISERIFLDQKKAKLIVPNDLEQYFRQYSSNIQIYSKRAGEEGAAEVAGQMAQQWPDIEVITKNAAAHDVDILVFDIEQHGFSDSPADYGYEFYDNIGHYDLYRKKKNKS